MGTLIRVTLTATFLSALVVLAGMALSTPAYPGESEHAMSVPNPTPLPKAKPAQCAMPLSRVVGDPNWRVFRGIAALKYLAVAFQNPPLADAIAYTRAGDRVGLVLARGNCIFAKQIVSAEHHRKVMDAVFGWTV